MVKKKNDGRLVSVPIRGLFNLTLTRDPEVRYTQSGKFPSPSGDYFFNIPLKLVKDILNRCEQFPSPLGDYLI